MDLARFSSSGFDRGRPRVVELLWLITRAVFFARWNPFNATRVLALKAFGAKIGRGVVAKPGLKVKFPWRLSVGDHCWLGEDAWIDNLGIVTIGRSSCVSQGAYLCTGSHDLRKVTFDLIVEPIHIGSGCWIGAKAVVAPGTTVGDGAVVGMATLVKGHVLAGTRQVSAESVVRNLPATG